jgi:hypothetical protein
MAAEWLAEVLGATVPEFGFESLPQHEHPMMPPQLRRVLPTTEPGDVSVFMAQVQDTCLCRSRHKHVHAAIRVMPSVPDHGGSGARCSGALRIAASA